MENPVDFTFYTDVYKGSKISSADFPELSERAFDWIAQNTFGRLDTPQGVLHLNAIRKACCAVAEALLLNQQGGGKVSETVGSYSVNYAAGISNTESNAQRLRRAAKRYLAGTDLMYRGCG